MNYMFAQYVAGHSLDAAFLCFYLNSQGQIERTPGIQIRNFVVIATARQMKNNI